MACCCCGRASLLEHEALLHHIMDCMAAVIETPALRVLPCRAPCCTCPCCHGLWHRLWSCCSHGAPRPEDDPANFEGGKRVRGPSEDEVKKAQEERRKVKALQGWGSRTCPEGFMCSLGHGMTGC